jgi:SAM-dependent methyltransferase
MATLNWLKGVFTDGYSSGNITSLLPSPQRWREERIIGGCYKDVVKKGILPFLRKDSVVLEIGPGRGSWTRVLLKYAPEGTVHVVDLHDAAQWLEPKKYGGRLKCHQIEDNNGYSIFPDQYFDFCFSFGVLCHNNIASIDEILRNTFRKTKPGAYAVHHHGDWEKLESYGWQNGRVPTEFKDRQDDDIWWPRNSQEIMGDAATRAGWTVVTPDLGVVKRDSITVLQRPL